MRIVFQRFLFLFARNQFRTASRVLIVSFLFSLLPVENCSAQLNNTRFVFTSRFPWNYLWLFQIRVPLVKKKISSYTRIVFQSLCSHFAHINLRFLSLFSFTKNCFPRVNHAFVISLPFRLAHVNYICYVSFLLSLWWKIVSYARTTFPLFLYIYFFFHPPPPPCENVNCVSTVSRFNFSFETPKRFIFWDDRRESNGTAIRKTSSRHGQNWFDRGKTVTQSLQ